MGSVNLDPLRTQVKANTLAFPLAYEAPILMIGSCFSETIGNRLQLAGFEIVKNPFGISFNPHSVAHSLERISENRTVVESELITENGLWHHWDFHSDYSALTPRQALEKMSHSVETAHQSVRDYSHVILTLGTAWCFENQEGHIVNNCHKVPTTQFNRRKLGVDEIVTELSRAIKTLREHNSAVRVLLTLSPVRHWKDGAIENSSSKATLRLAIDELQFSLDGVEYFPAYEILIDELRDYRFYADDMLHPSHLAEEIIWARFMDVAMTDSSKAIVTEVMKYRKMESHRPMFPGSVGDIEFKAKLKLTHDNLMTAYPQLKL